MSLEDMRRELIERYERLKTSGTGEKIPYGRANMVGMRPRFLREILPKWEWDKEKWLLSSPNRKITFHSHYTEISEDLVPYKDEIMKAMTSIRPIFLDIPATLVMANEPAAIDLFKKRTKPYADVLNKYGSR